MKKIKGNYVILTEQEFLDIIPEDMEVVSDLIGLYGGETTLMEVLDDLKEKRLFEED